MASNLRIFQLIKEKDSKFNLKNLEAFIFAFCLFLLTPPFFVWHSISPLILVLICSLLSINNFNHKERFTIEFFVAFLFIYLYAAFNNQQNILSIIAILVVVTLLITSSDFLKNVFTKYIYIFSITLIPSIIFFLAINFFRIDIPHSIITPLNTFKDYSYTQYYFLVQANDPLDISRHRFFGMYDEPGVIGTISAVILLSTGFNLKRKINIPIFIAGILSFSFAFYMITLVYGFIFLRLKYKFILAIMIIGVVILFSENELLNKNIFSRFEYSNGKIAGDNRTSEKFEKFYEKYSSSSDFYFGLGANASLEKNEGGASYKDLIVNNGIIFFILFSGLCILRAFSQIQLKKEFFIYLLILFSILYQRPFITEYFYFFLILAPVPFFSNSIFEDRFNQTIDKKDIFRKLIKKQTIRKV